MTMFMLMMGLAGLLVLALGWRGRMINNRPWCRSCRYDLGALDDATAACPECGSDLGKPKTVRIGHRRRRGRVVILGLLILILDGGIFGAWTWGRVTRFDWTRTFPSWVLVMQARGGDGPQSDAAVTELLARLNAGDLSQAHVTFLVDRALAEQADPNGDWFLRWDSVFEAAWSAGMVSEGHVLEYARGFWDVELRHRATVRPDRSWTADEFVHALKGMPTLGTPTLLELRQIKVGDQVVYSYRPFDAAQLARVAGAGRRGRPDMDWSSRSDLHAAIDLPEGEYPVEATFDVWILDQNQTPPKPLSVVVHKSSTIKIVSPASNLVQPSTDAPLRDAVLLALDARDVRVTIDPNTRSTWSAIHAQDLPLAVAFDVYWRVAGNEIHVGTTASLPKPGVSHSLQYGGWEYLLPEFDERVVDVILRPNVRVAEELLPADVDEIFGEEIVFENVPVTINDRRPPPVNPPVTPPGDTNDPGSPESPPG